MLTTTPRTWHHLSKRRLRAQPALSRIHCLPPRHTRRSTLIFVYVPFYPRWIWALVTTAISPLNKRLWTGFRCVPHATVASPLQRAPFRGARIPVHRDGGKPGTGQEVAKAMTQRDVAGGTLRYDRGPCEQRSKPLFFTVSRLLLLLGLLGSPYWIVL